MPPKTLKKSTIALLFLATLTASLFLVKTAIDYELSLEKTYPLSLSRTMAGEGEIDTTDAIWNRPVVVYRILATTITILLLLIVLGAVCFHRKYWRLYRTAEEEMKNVCAEIEDYQNKQGYPDGHTRDGTGRQARQFSNDATTGLLANMAHEIFSPMNSIIGFGTVLRRSSLNDKQQEQLNALMSASGRLLDIIDGILNYARVKTGRIELKPVDFDLKGLINDVLKDVSPKITEKPVTLKRDIHPDVPGFVRADPDRLRQILIFLLHNAIKFTREGEITVSVRQDNPVSKEGRLRFAVRDTGMGIPQEYKPVVFRVFLQSDRAVIRKFGDTAMGLMLSKEYVALMGGEIKVESQAGEGSEFLFTIPYKESQPISGDRGEPGQDAVLPGRDENGCQGMNVLVVEDNPPNRVLIKMYLRAIGSQGDYAGNGEDAITKLKDKDYDFCLMDIHLPGMSGFETARVIRNELKKDLPIIGLTADLSQAESETCRAAGMNDCLKKPLLLPQLKEMILKWTRNLQPG